MTAMTTIDNTVPARSGVWVSLLARLRAILLLGFWFASVALLAPIVCSLTRITGNENYVYGPVKFFVRAGLKLAGVTVKVSGLEKLDASRTYVFTPNHQSLIEVPVLFTFLGFNVAYLAKQELFKIPIFGWGIRTIGLIPVDRRNTQAAVESARKATEKLASGKSYVVYPEGTRSPDGRLLPFKKGAFLMAADAGVPVAPVAVAGSAAIMPKGKLSVHSGTIRLEVLDPIDVAGRPRETISAMVSEVADSISSVLARYESGDRDTHPGEST